MIFKSVLLFIAATLVLQYASADIPKPGTVASMGVNIHFTDPRPGEMKELSAAGFKFHLASHHGMRAECRPNNKRGLI